MAAYPFRERRRSRERCLSRHRTQTLECQKRFIIEERFFQRSSQKQAHHERENDHAQETGDEDRGVPEMEAE